MKKNLNKRLAMLFDLRRCIGCSSCAVACKSENDVPLGVWRCWVKKTEKGRFPNTREYFLPIVCNNCEKPICVTVCPVNAGIKRPDGIVYIDPHRCIGCRYCMIACPFNIPAYEYDDPFSPEVKKCTMCFERYAQEGKAPACASTCPREAIIFGRRSDLIKIARQRIHDHPDQYVDHIYGEHEVGGTCWLYLSPAPFEELGFRTDLGEIPYPEKTKPFLSAVSLVLTIWPMLLMGTYAFSHNHKDRPEVQDHDKEEASS